MSSKRILVFAPYGSWGVHHQLDAVLGAALRARGCEVRVLACDGLMEQCFIAGKPPSPETCRQCADSGRRLFSTFNLPVTQMRSLLTPADMSAAAEWAAAQPAEALAGAEYEGVPMGDWVSSSVHTYFLTGNLDFSRPEVAGMYRRQLRNGALVLRAMRKMIADFRPDHLLSFNSLHSYYRVAFEAAHEAGIRVLVHERGMVDDTFLLLPDSTANHYEPRWDAWREWQDVPLTAEACSQVAAYFRGRELGKGTNFNPFYSFSSDAAEVRRHLRIPDDARLVAVFASTEREIGAIKGLIRRTFDTQAEWLRRLAALMADKDVYLVIRHHPNNTVKGVVDHDFIKAMAALNLEYGDRVRVCMPYERITSYAIMRNAEAVFTYYSTTEAEAVLRGIPAVCAAESVYIPMGVEFLRDQADLPAVIDKALAGGALRGIEDLRKAHRYAHFLFFKLNLRFDSVGIKNVYEMDIRIRGYEDLQPGRDAALDQVCRHILEGAPLYSLPSEAERAASDRAETAFLERQLEEIRSLRIPVKAGPATPFAEPLISVIGVTSGPAQDGASFLERSLRRSRHKRVERIGATIPRDAGAGEILLALRKALGRAGGDIIYVVPENVAVDESLLSTSADILAKAGEDGPQAVAWSAWLADGEGNVSGEVLAGDAPIAYKASLVTLPALADPVQLLAFFVMRRSFLEMVCEYMEAFTLPSPGDISALFFAAFYEKKDGTAVHRAGLPMLMVHPPRAAAAADRKGGTEAEDGRDGEIRDALLEYADRLERNPYDRASILGSANMLKQMGDGDTALSVLAHYLEKNAQDEEIRGLAEDLGWKGAKRPSPAFAVAEGADARRSVPAEAPVATAQAATAPAPTSGGRAAGWAAAPANPFAGEKVYATYEDARPLVETVSGWLLDGQEKFLFDMAKAVPEGGSILEMGADRGRSTCAMGLACSGSDKRIYSIDTFCGNDGIMGKTYDFQHEWYANLKRVGVERHCEAVKGLTFEVLPTWSERPMLDFVFIDASHEYIDVLKDFMLVYPFVKPGGWIAFHDVEPNWPGPWRVWLEHAVPLLAEHRQVATLTCGRKVAGRPFDWVQKPLGFSFAAHWIRDLAKAYGDGSPLFDAMRASLGFASAPPSSRDGILRQEQILRQLPEPLVTTLRCMLGKDAYMDGHLHHWNGIVLMAQGKSAEARQEFLEAARVSYPVHPDQAAHYLAQLGGPSAGPTRIETGSPAQPRATKAAAAGGHYGQEYFDWQKRIGAFGGVANLFKFRDHVGQSDVVVDFGSGGGFLLRNLPGRVKVGVEINETARKEASLKAGIDAFEGAAELPDGCADVIVSNHALEHVHSPLDTLRLLRRKLKPGGRMVCVVPHDGPQIAYDPADVNKHLFTWNPMTLGNLFAAAGFEVLAAENLQHQWPPDYVAAYESLGEEGFHRACREQAARNGNYQVRVIAVRGADPAEPRKAGESWSAAPVSEANAAAAATAKAPAFTGRSLMELDDIPVALVAYKRPEHTARVLKALKEGGARNIHIFCDGARSGGDAEAVERTRKLCRAVDWARPEIHEAPENRGLARSIMGAVDGLLERHETLILLEDDCVPQRHFFDFMRKCLTYYRDREEVFGVSGYTVQIPQALLDGYPHDLYFLPRIGSWGWATWKRAWSKLERDLRKATREALDRRIDLVQGGSDVPLILNGVLQGTTKDVWTLNWMLTVYLNRGHFIYPTVSHIENIGMDGTGVHCGPTDRYDTRPADRPATRFPDRIAADPGLLANFRKYYDV